MTGEPTCRMTVLVLAYNQERYVREAVASALQQTAQGLEIIMSDDASSDRTFDIMQEMAAQYDGPHRVHCRRNTKNMGTNAHINALVEQAESDRIACFAGDDISAPHRAETLLKTFAAEDPLLIHSDAVAIDAEGRVVDDAIFRQASFFRTTDPMEIATSQSLYLGASVAFHRDLFRKYGPLPVSPAYEDLILGFRAAMEGRVSFVREALLQYRTDIGISRPEAAPCSRIEHEAALRRRLEREIAVLEQRIKDAKRFSDDPRNPLLKRLAKAHEKAALRLDFHVLGPMRGTRPLLKRLRTALSEFKRIRGANRRR